MVHSFQGESLKVKTADQFLFMHNTIVGWDPFIGRADGLLMAYVRNNLWFSADETDYVLRFGQQEPDWRTNVDYDGIGTTNGRGSINWNAQWYSDISSLFADHGIYEHGIIVWLEYIAA